MPLIDKYFKEINLNWAEKSKIDNESVRSQLIINTIHGIKTGLLMLHPITPVSCDFVIKYLNADNKVFDWDLSELTFAEIYPNITRFKEIEPKFDFFKKHFTQLLEKR